MPDTPITLDRSAAGPLFQQIAARLRAAILAGTLPGGARLPSSRGLASQLGIARGTVDAAYAMLAGEGVLLSQGAAGTYVARHIAVQQEPARQPRAPARVASTPTPQRVLPFRMGLPALDAFPRKLWSALATREMRRFSAAHLTYPDPAGYRPLREAIAAYLGISRGIKVDAEQVWITGGFQGALSLVKRAVLSQGDRVWVEDPGYFLSREALRAAGMALIPVPVDRDGLCIDAGLARAPDARLALVTPTHQSPLGVALSLQRRLALLAWAAGANAWVLEDDYDSEFRYTGHPLPALKSLDRAERVLFAGSFSKVLFPGLRLGYLVVPDQLADIVARASYFLQVGQAELEQRIVAAFMAEGHFARHLRRMRSLYAARRNALAQALAAEFGERVRIELQAGGMHLIARFAVATRDVELVQRASAEGLEPAALSSLTIEHDSGQGLLLSFTNIPEAEAPAIASRLAHALGALFR